MITAEDLIDEAVGQPFSGWDFSWLRGRMVTETLPWDFEATVRSRSRSVGSMLDLGTGGGERLAAVAPLPLITAATESYEPNLAVARDRLAPFGADVVKCEAAPDNARQATVGAPTTPLPALPFRDRSVELVTARHEAFVAGEVARVLRPRGRFITQQTGPGDNVDLYILLGLRPPAPDPGVPVWDLSLATSQVNGAGLHLVDSAAATVVTRFHDVGALVYFLKAVPWEVPEFSAARFRSRLVMLHDRISEAGPLECRIHRFWLEASNCLQSR